MLERLSDEHMSSPVAAPGARRGFATTSTGRPTGLPRDDEELVAYVTQVVMQAEREPASAEAMELSFLELERARLDDEIAAADDGAAHPRSTLQRERARLTERIARSQS